MSSLLLRTLLAASATLISASALATPLPAPSPRTGYDAETLTRKGVDVNEANEGEVLFSHHIFRDMRRAVPRDVAVAHIPWWYRVPQVGRPSLRVAFRLQGYDSPTDFHEHEPLPNWLDANRWSTRAALRVEPLPISVAKLPFWSEEVKLHERTVRPATHGRASSQHVALREIPKEPPIGPGPREHASIGNGRLALREVSTSKEPPVGPGPRERA